MLPTEAQVWHPKGFFYEGILPDFVNETQPPQTKRPFTSITKTPWAHTINLLIPAHLAKDVQDGLQAQSSSFAYAKVMMSLGEVLNGEFFTQYIKRGNISMLSEGHRGVDNTFSLHEGILRLEMDRPTYERAGLVGDVISNQGTKHRKSRYKVEFNLRLPSMLHGKKGFDRLVWASKHVFNSSLTWLFFNHETPRSDNKDDPVSIHHPLWFANKPQLLPRNDVAVPPSLDQLTKSETLQQLATDNEYVSQLAEWLSLIMMGSPRVTSHDSVDPYLCRYQLPGQPELDGNTAKATMDIACLRWHGFVPSHRILAVFLVMLKSVSTEWSALSINRFDGGSCTILQLPQDKGANVYFEWERVPHR